MKIGITIYPLLEAENIFPTAQELIELLISSEIGLNHFEVHTNKVDLLEEEILKLIKASGAKFSVHAPYIYKDTLINFCSAKPKDIIEARKWLEKSITLAKELNAKNIIIHPDMPKKCTRKQAEEILRQHLNYGLKIINKDQYLLLENLPGKKYTFFSPAPMKKFIGSFHSRQLGVCWDIGHAKQAIGNSYLSFPRILKNLIKECHFSDIKKTRKGLTDHYPLGSGILNFKKIIRELKKINFSGLIVMEIIPKEAGEIAISKKVLEQAIKEA